MFRGRYETAVDEKGRTSLPARFRELLLAGDDQQMVITTALEPCLVAYPLGAWNAFERKLAAQSAFDPNVVQLKRLYVTGAKECALDSHGRILIPQLLREYAAISRAVIWSGMVDYLEIWDRERWQKALEQAQGGAASLGKALSDLGL